MSDYHFTVTQYEQQMPLHRRGWVPYPDLGLAGAWLGAVVSDAQGNRYWGLRGHDDFITGMTHVVAPLCGFRRLPEAFDEDVPHLFPLYAGIDFFEPMRHENGADSSRLQYPSGLIRRDDNGLHWFDAAESWELHARPVGDVVLTHVPAQDGIDHDALYRHELLYASGTVNGVEVSGYAHQDYAYGPRGSIYTELSIPRRLQGMWVSWLHEFADDTAGGGSFWQGRDGVAFGPGYHVHQGSTTTHHDVVATPTFDELGHMVLLEVTMGAESFTFTMYGYGSPIHVFGELTSSSLPEVPVRSWCWVEYAGSMLTPELLDMATSAFDLSRGR